MHATRIPAMNPEKSRSSNRLEALTRIVREVDSAPDLDNALHVIVRRTREVMAADVCTVYFSEHELRRHVIAATDGLSPELVGQVQAGFCQGLIGRVADSSHPVNLAHVPKALDREFLAQSGTGRYHAFLGVPVIHKRRVQGVLLVRQRKARRFNGEIANDPGCALLLGMGFDGLSISASAIPRAKWAIRSVPAVHMQGLAKQGLQLERPELVHDLLEQVLLDATF